MENNPDSLGLLLAEKHAVDEPVIDVTEKYPQATETPKEEPTAKRAFGKSYFTHKSSRKVMSHWIV